MHNNFVCETVALPESWDVMYLLHIYLVWLAKLLS